MKKTKQIFVVFLLLLVFIASIAFTNKNGMWFQNKNTSDAYIFKKYDGDKELSWSELKEYYQVPSEELTKISTAGLIETCLNYPLFASGMIFSNDSMYSGFKSTLKSFNGFHSLFERKDAGSELMELYMNIDLDSILANDKYPIFRLKYLEYIIAQDEILDGLSAIQRGKLCKKCAENFILECQNYSDSFYPDSTLLVAAKILARNSLEFDNLTDRYPNIASFIITGDIEELSEDEIQAVLDLVLKQTRWAGDNNDE